MDLFIFRLTSQFRAKVVEEYSNSNILRLHVVGYMLSLP